jgi:hypothetical protein
MLMEHQGSLSYLVLGFSLICLAIALLSVSIMIQSRGGTLLTKNSCSGALRSWGLPLHVPRELGDNHERNSSCFWNIRMYPCLSTNIPTKWK